jgi:hypothetical protein
MLAPMLILSTFITLATSASTPMSRPGAHARALA